MHITVNPFIVYASCMLVSGIFLIRHRSHLMHQYMLTAEDMAMIPKGVGGGYTIGYALILACWGVSFLLRNHVIGYLAVPVLYFNCRVILYAMTVTAMANAAMKKKEQPD